VIVLYYLLWNYRPGGDATAAGWRHEVPEPKKSVEKNIVRISHEKCTIPVL
jgi:hypothetical protein